MNTAAKKDTIWGKQMQDIICGEWVNKKKSGGDKTLQLERSFDLVHLGAVKGESVMGFLCRNEEEKWNWAVQECRLLQQVTCHSFFYPEYSHEFVMKRKKFSMKEVEKILIYFL